MRRKKLKNKYSKNYIFTINKKRFIFGTYKQNIGLAHTAARSSNFSACYLRFTEEKQLS